MDLPKIDPRTKEDLIQYMKKYLSSYTPEWRFDDEHLDVGAALALIYADMMSETVYRFNQIPEKNREMFFDKIGASLLPAVPAKGNITFSLVNDEVEGVAVRRGEAVLADSEEGESLIFETQNDVYITPATPDCFYLCNRERDQISLLFERKEESDTPSCPLFDLQGENIQAHVLYFSHPHILNIKNEAWIYCSFLSNTGRMISEAHLQSFLDEENVIFEYYTQEGFVPFKERNVVSDQIGLKKEGNQPAFAIYEHDGLESYWIRCIVKDVRPFEHFIISTMGLRSEARRIFPEAVNAKGIDQKIREFFPFGERPSLFDEVYFISDEVFGKREANITLNFDLDYVKLPLEVQEIENEINWKAIMKRTEVKVDVEYDISIAEVIWEYFNGEGYARLFPDEKHSNLFGIQEGVRSRQVTLRFRCPADITPVLVNSTTACCIRARVLKMNNMYKMRGSYISPLVSNPTLSYQYIQEDLTPEYFSALNNLDILRIPEYGLKAAGLEVSPFAGRTEEATTLYLGFEKPLRYGPIRMLFSMEENIQSPMPRLHFEYSTEKGWNNLRVVDETENFRKTGIITMMGRTDFASKRLFGKERYWLRIVDVNHEYFKKRESQTLQKLTGIYMNTTQISAVETMEPELFTIAPNEENRRCVLRNNQIYHIRVWVNEYKTLHSEELLELEKHHGIQYEYAPNGAVEAIWVEWKEVRAFDFLDPDFRGYQVDRIDGVVLFPDGKRGRIPTSDGEPTIRVEYSCGGGREGNLPEHRIQRMNRAIGFISAVDNHEMITGGCDQEQMQDALIRSASALRHGYRAVTASDYETLAKEATRNILKVKCFSNRDETGEKAYGHITLVVLMKDYEKGRKHFDSVRSQIREYMKDRMSVHLMQQNRFHIIEPVFLELSATVSLTVSDYNQVFDVRRKVQERIEAFLNPVTGNYHQSGWEIGSIPNATQILNALKDIKEVHLMETVRLTASRRGRRRTAEVDLDRMIQNPYILPLNKEHEINIKVK